MCHRNLGPTARILYVYGHHASVSPSAEGATSHHNALRDRLAIAVQTPGFGHQRRVEDPQDSRNGLALVIWHRFYQALCEAQAVRHRHRFPPAGVWCLRSSRPFSRESSPPRR